MSAIKEYYYAEINCLFSEEFSKHFKRIQFANSLFSKHGHDDPDLVPLKKDLEQSEIIIHDNAFVSVDGQVGRADVYSHPMFGHCGFETDEPFADTYIHRLTDDMPWLSCEA